MINRPHALYCNGEIIGVISNPDPFGSIDDIVNGLNFAATESVDGDGDDFVTSVEIPTTMRTNVGPGRRPASGWTDFEVALEKLGVAEVIEPERWVAQNDDGNVLCDGPSHQAVLDQLPPQIENEVTINKVASQDAKLPDVGVVLDLLGTSVRTEYYQKVAAAVDERWREELLVFKGYQLHGGSVEDYDGPSLRDIIVSTLEEL